MKLIVAAAFVLFPTLVAAEPADIAAIGAECQGPMRQSATACSCLTGRASGELDDAQQRYVAAAFTDNQAAMASQQQSLSEAEISGIGRFMSSALSACGVTQ